MSRVNVTSLRHKENGCWRGEAFGKSAPFATEEHEVHSTTSCDVLPFTSRGLGGLPMGRVPDDVEKGRAVIAMEKVAYAASEMLNSTDLSFEFPSIEPTSVSPGM